MEYIDGELKEKSALGFAHGEIQIIFGEWFRAHRKEWQIRVAVETRTQVEQTRVRLPDLVVVSRQERSTDTLVSPALIAIEVLAPTDTYSDLKNRAANLYAMGTRNIWLIDPELRTAEVWTGSSWLPHAGPILKALDSPMHIDLAWLWAELDD